MSTPRELVARYATQSEMSSFFSDSLGIYNVKSYSAVGDGTTDDYTALYNANDVANDNGGIIFFPVGTYKISSDITFSSNVTLWFADGAKLSVDSGKTVTINGALTAEQSQIFSGSGSIVLSTKANHVYPVWFGAVYDNATNDYSAINNAISSITSCGGTVDFGENKTYLLTTYIQLQSNIEYIGKNVIINFNFSSQARFDIDTENDIKIKGINFKNYDDGQSAPTIYDGAIRVYSASANGASRILIEDCTFTDCKCGIQLSGAAANAVSNIKILNSRFVGTVATPNGKMHVGINYNMGRFVTIKDCKFEGFASNTGYTTAGINMINADASIEVRHALIENNWFETPDITGADGHAHIYLKNCYYVKIKDNYFTESSMGISMLDNTKYCTIHSNTFDTIDIAEAIVIASGTDNSIQHIKIHDNSFIGCKYPIKSWNAEGVGIRKYISISGNTFDNCNENISLTGTYKFTSINNNIIDETNDWGITITGSTDSFTVQNIMVSNNVGGSFRLNNTASLDYTGIVIDGNISNKRQYNDYYIPNFSIITNNYGGGCYLTNSNQSIISGNLFYGTTNTNGVVKEYTGRTNTIMTNNLSFGHLNDFLIPSSGQIEADAHWIVANNLYQTGSLTVSSSGNVFTDNLVATS